MAEQKDARPKHYQALNNRTLKPILNFLKEHFGFSKKLDYVFLLSSKSRLYAASRELFDLPVEKLKINSFGVYFGEWRNEEVRLSIEGSQIIGPHCTKNVLELTVEQRDIWMAGLDMPKGDFSGYGFMLIKCGDDFLGCARLTDETLLNYVPKNRRKRLEV